MSYFFFWGQLLGISGQFFQTILWDKFLGRDRGLAICFLESNIFRENISKITSFGLHGVESRMPGTLIITAKLWYLINFGHRGHF